MAFFPCCLDRTGATPWSIASRRISASRRPNGTVEVRDGASFISFTGLAIPRFAAPFMPCVEIGWRLGFEHWGRGYATEAARLALDYGSGPRGFPRDRVVTAATTSARAPSWNGSACAAILPTISTILPHGHACGGTCSTGWGLRLDDEGGPRQSAAIDRVAPERRHDRLRHPLELLEHHRSAALHRLVDRLMCSMPGEARLELLQMLDEIVRRAGNQSRAS